VTKVGSTMQIMPLSNIGCQKFKILLIQGGDQPPCW